MNILLMYLKKLSMLIAALHLLKFCHLKIITWDTWTWKINKFSPLLSLGNL